MAGIHTCSYKCERPACIRAQRDELAARLERTVNADPETLRLHLGELTPDEVRIAQAAIRYALGGGE